MSDELNQHDDFEQDLPEQIAVRLAKRERLNELGEAYSGVAVRFLGPIGAAVYGGIGALTATGLWARWFPDLRKADRLE